MSTVLFNHWNFSCIQVLANNRIGTKCGHTWVTMFCLRDPVSDEEAELRRDQRRRNKSINAEIRRDKDEYRATHRLLLLGKLMLWPDLVFNCTEVVHVRVSLFGYYRYANYGRVSWWDDFHLTKTKQKTLTPVNTWGCFYCFYHMYSCILVILLFKILIFQVASL